MEILLSNSKKIIGDDYYFLKKTDEVDYKNLKKSLKNITCEEKQW